MSARPHKPELLAPAGSAASLAAALHSGADAVYFGLQDGFNARARAANFTLAGLPATVAQVHRAGARAFLTVNTLVFEPELEHVERVLRAAITAGVDALIVQDPAVCLLARELCPEMELHASTQMTIANPTAAEFAAALGVSRVVVPRELSLAEIKAFAAGTALELEVFVHGALCVSWSGQCLTSEAWGGRSANRGQCAQSCRLPYDLLVDGERRDLGDVRYLLSPKDLAGAKAVPELVALGVHGLKIEGRQKGPGYVTTAVRGYRRWLDAVAAGGDLTEAKRELGQDLLSMSLAYSRGFADGFFGGSDHQTLVEGRFPKHRGECLGRVVEVRGNEVVVRQAASQRPWTGAAALDQPPTEPQGTTSSPLATTLDAVALEPQPGQGVVFDQGEPQRQDEPGGPIFRAARRGADWVLGFGVPGPDLTGVRVGDRVWVTADPSITALADRAVKQAEPAGRVPLALRVSGHAGGRLRLEAHSGRCQASLESATVLAVAHGHGLDAALLRAKLGALGGTPFRLDSLSIEALAPGLHLPPPELKELRRRLVTELVGQLERGGQRRLAATPVLAQVKSRLEVAPAVGPTELVALCRTDAQLDAAIGVGLAEVELDWLELTGLGRAVERTRAAGLRAVVATPRIGKPNEEAIDDRLWRLAPDGLLVRHFGAMVRFLKYRGTQSRPALHGDFSLNVTNSVTARCLLRQGLDTVTAAYDLDTDQLLALLANAPASRIAVQAQHRIPMFHTEHCIYAHQLSNGRDYRSCGRPCERHQVALRDPQGRELPVIVDVGCRNTVFRHAPQSAAASAQQFVALGVRRFRVEFVREERGPAERALRSWQRLLAGQANAEEVLRVTGAEPRIGVADQRMELLGE